MLEKASDLFLESSSPASPLSCRLEPFHKGIEGFWFLSSGVVLPNYSPPPHLRRSARLSFPRHIPPPSFEKYLAP